ncbi:MAG: DUF1211 domain-containing protein [Candidatus Eisenbacteria bacterium]|nr:DUF1211 domain-containing protein [Candidatus Eisenbacteria bacterium]
MKPSSKLPFRERSREPMRLEGFADAVLGFAVTLAVVSLDVPRTSGDLIMLVRGALSFAMTFAILVGIWYTHNRFCRRYGLDDDKTVGLTAALLFVAVFYTYPVKFLMAATFDPWLGAPERVVDSTGVLVEVMKKEHIGAVMALYGLGYGLVNLIFWLMHRHAYALRGALQLNAAEELETRLTVGLFRDATVFSLSFISFWPVTLIPRGPSRRWILLGFVVVILAALWVFIRRTHQAQLERRRFIEGGERTASPGPGATV